MGFKERVHDAMRELGDPNSGLGSARTTVPLWSHEGSTAIAAASATLTAAQMNNRFLQLTVSAGGTTNTLPDGSAGQVITIGPGTANLAAADIDADTATGWLTAVMGTGGEDYITLMYLDDTVGWIILGTGGDTDGFMVIT